MCAADVRLFNKAVNVSATRLEDDRFEIRPRVISDEKQPESVARLGLMGTAVHLRLHLPVS